MGQPVKSDKKPPEIQNNYPVRVTACMVALALHLNLFWGAEDVSPFLWLFVIVHTLIYPHVIVVISKTSKDESRNILIDAVLYGCTLSLWGYNLYLVTIFVGCCIMTNFAAGGFRFFIKGWLLLILGMLLPLIFIDPYYREHISFLPKIIASFGLLIYMVVIGHLVYRIDISLIRTKNNLVQQKEELINMNKLAVTVNANLDLDTIMEAVMTTLNDIYPLETLYMLSINQETKIVKFIGAYGSQVEPAERDAFLDISMDTEKDKESIVVSGLVNDRVIYIKDVGLHGAPLGATVDRQLFEIKPCISIAYFPIHEEGRVVAGVAFVNYENALVLEDADLERISNYLVQVGTAFKNLTLFNLTKSAKESAENARIKAEESEQAKSHFLANMSHEIRTPMTAIIGYSEALQEDSINRQEQQEFTATIIRSGKHLMSIIDDILDLSKIEASQLEIENIKFNFSQIIKDFISYGTIRAKEKNLSFSIDIDFPIPRELISDPTRIKQVLYNLINNAAKFTSNGGVTLRIHYLKSQLKISVVDTGIGMDYEQQQKVFQAFSQADASITRLYGGTGLGLYISKKLSELLGGELRLKSEVEKGSEFTLVINLKEGNADMINSMEEIDSEIVQPSHRERPNVPNLKEYSILVAEDNDENQKIVNRYLSKTGVDVTYVDNGQKAVDKAFSHTYDLILLDMQMPIMSGKEAAKKIKNKFRHIPLVAFTANVMDFQVKEYKKLGFVEVIEKPINKESLYVAIRNALQVSNIIPGGKALVVEDNKVNQMLMVRYLVKLKPDIHVDVVSDGKQAVNAIEAKTYNLILMDMEMPIMGGLEATKDIRKQGFTVPIYMVTGNTDRYHVKQSIESGASGYLKKPIDSTELKKVIEEVFSKKIQLIE